MLIIDFETRSRCDLITQGTDNYVKHPTTEALCCSFIPQDPEDEREWLWYPHDGPLPQEVIDEIASADYIAAHNAAFDRGIWEYVAAELYEFPPIPFDKWYCTSAQMRVNNLPASLADACRALDATHKKDHAGAALIRRLSIPDKKTGEFNEDPADLLRMGAYCMKDSRATKSCVNATRFMTVVEHDDWLNNEDINERGVKIDTELARAAQRYANDEYLEIAAALEQATNGVVFKHTQTARAAKWILSQCAPTHPIMEHMTKYVEGEPKLSIDKNARQSIIDAYEDSEDPLQVPAGVMDVVNALQEGSKSSVSKFKNMYLRADDVTERVHGAFVYAGASQTLRYASRGLQMHNMPSRGLYETVEEAWATYDQMLSGCDIDAPVMDTLKKMLRHALMPEEGNVFVIGDWTGIEARVLPWLADTTQAHAKLAKIAGGADVYLETAASIGYEGHRSLGKVMELACGYEGGVNAFMVFAKMYGVTGLSEFEIKAAIKNWRAANSWCVQFWRDLESAAIRAIRSPKTMQAAGKIRYLFAPELIGGTLLCLLPDDSVLQYPKARLESRKGRPQITAMKASIKMKADAKEWPRESLFGGRLAGNATQGTAAALLRHLISLRDDIVAHVHDEVVLEVLIEAADKVAAELRKQMETPPEWARGLTLDTVPEIAERYKK